MSLLKNLSWTAFADGNIVLLRYFWSWTGISQLIFCPILIPMRAPSEHRQHLSDLGFPLTSGKLSRDKQDRSTRVGAVFATDPQCYLMSALLSPDTAVKRSAF